jgi:hypothetical protein
MEFCSPVEAYVRVVGYGKLVVGMMGWSVDTSCS